MTDSLRQEARARAARARVSPELMEAALLAQRAGRPYVVEQEDAGHGLFFRCTEEGPSRVLYINTGHPFFTQVYAAPGATDRFRAGLELLLWTLGTAELDASEADQHVYAIERGAWSRALRPALEALAEIFRDFDQAHEEDETEEAGR